MNRWKSLLPHGSVVIFAFKDSFSADELILENPTQARRTGTFLIWFGESDSSIPDVVSQEDFKNISSGLRTRLSSTGYW